MDQPDGEMGVFQTVRAVDQVIRVANLVFVAGSSYENARLRCISHLQWAVEHQLKVKPETAPLLAEFRNKLLDAHPRFNRELLVEAVALLEKHMLANLIAY